MDAAADDALDMTKVAYFRCRYAALDAEELAELAGRRDSLADEAQEALDRVLTNRGVCVSAAAAAATAVPETPSEQELSLARDLWAGLASRTGQVLCAMAFAILASRIARLFPGFGSSPAAAGYGAAAAGLFVAAVGYLGYRFGRYCTREICANADKPIAQRRMELRWFAAAVVVGYFVAFALLGAVLPQA